MILGSKKQFIEHYLSGRKEHSFRKGHRWRKGMGIQFYQDVRTSKMKKFMEDKECTGVQEVFMTITARNGFEISINDRYVYRSEWEVIAYNDGFDTPEEFIQFFFPKEKEAEWSGQLVHWGGLMNEQPYLS